MSIPSNPGAANMPAHVGPSDPAIKAAEQAVSVASESVYIDINKLHVVYGTGNDKKIEALEDINLQFAAGSFVSLVGPSGCGKSTLLKTVGDLLTPTTGKIAIGGVPAAELRRAGRIGMVFQQANLMPWLSVEDNVRLLWKLAAAQSGNANTIKPDVRGLLRSVGLEEFGDKRPDQLSGGMQQRVALARALALDPAILLMDEPFAALDEITRDRMGFELLRIWNEYRKTVLFVTHSLAEAVFLSDTVVLLTPRPGRVHRIVNINLPRPRASAIRLTDEFSSQVTELNRELYRMMM